MQESHSQSPIFTQTQNWRIGVRTLPLGWRSCDNSLLDFKAWTRFLMKKELELLSFSKALSLLSKSIRQLPQNKPQSLFIKIGSGYENRKINPPKAGLRSHNRPQNGYTGRKMHHKIDAQKWASLDRSTTILRSHNYFCDRIMVLRSQNRIFPDFSNLVITSCRNVQMINGLKR